MSLSNRMIGAILRSRSHSMMSSSVLLVSITGLRSGKVIETPVNYLPMDERLYTTSFRNRTWWRNLRGGQTCRIWLKGEQLTVQGTVIESPAELEPLFNRYFQISPASARFLGVKLTPDGAIPSAEMERLTREHVLIRFDLQTGTR